MRRWERHRTRWVFLSVRLLFLLLLVPAIVLNARLYAEPERDGVLAQLRFLRAAIDRGAAHQMQALFPEGFFFTHELYGLAWIDQGLAVPAGDPLRREALREARQALAQVVSEDGRRPFSGTIDPPFGIFYQGWSNWLHAGLLRIESPAERDPADVAAFEQDCDIIAKAFDSSPTPFLVSYPGEAWPVDSVVAIASLRAHDAILTPRFGATIDRWLIETQKHLDPKTSLIPHRVDPFTGQPLEPARGTSQSMINRFLVEIEPVWAGEQYERFRRTFVVTRLGLPGVREFPDGVDGSADVDSGPLLFGVSMSASVVTAGAARLHDDRELATTLYGTMESLGLPFTLSGRKRYALGLVPAGDAFIAWSSGAQRWTPGSLAAHYPRRLSPLWRLPMHAATAVPFGILFWALFLRRKSPAKTDE
jgi:hypothetical protein